MGSMTTPLDRRRLGQSEASWSPIGLGTWQFSQGHGLIGRFWPTLTQDYITAIVKATVDGGISWFDTAEAYGRGQSERALAMALETLHVDVDTISIATKWWPLLRSSHHLQHSIGARLQALNQHPIALYQIHQPFARSSIESQMRAMASLLDHGLIKQAGVSNFTASQMVLAHRTLKSCGHALASNQVHYNLLHRNIESNGILANARELGISLIAYSPLAQGLLTGKFHQGTASPRGFRRWSPQFRPEVLRTTAPLIRAMQDLAERYEVEVSQVALNWVITSAGDTVFAIPGASSPKQAAANSKAMGWALTHDEWAMLSDLSTNFR